MRGVYIVKPNMLAMVVMPQPHKSVIGGYYSLTRQKIMVPQPINTSDRKARSLCNKYTIL